MGPGFVEERKKGPPAYMVSFGDMMTLILTFFILLVSMSKEQLPGLLAKGLGSFAMELRTHGLTGSLTADERKEIFDYYRRRFMLPEEQDPEQRGEHETASNLELIKSKALEMLRPHHEMVQFRVALFDADSARLDAATRSYLDRLADTLRPGRRQLLILEGHAGDAGASFRGDDLRLASARAEAVRAYVVSEHGFAPERVEARAWMAEIDRATPDLRSVDARLVTPERADK